MTLRPVTPEESQAFRDELEDRLRVALEEALRAFLADVKRAALSGLAASPSTLPMTAAASIPDPLPDGEIPSLGETAGRWAAGVDSGVTAAVDASFAAAMLRYSTAGLVVDSPADEAMQTYVKGVRDRLVQGSYFGVTVYEESFDAVRRSLAESVAEGWTRPQLAQRIAAELSWEQDGPYWRGVQAKADGQIDSMLDKLGPPGHPAREYARLNDPRVAALRTQRNLAIKHLDDERSVWQTRATLIARTESTGVTNYGAQVALLQEGVESKVWVATMDRRTRASHASASGQEVHIDKTFTVGSSQLKFPGDPAGPVHEVAACRCTMIAGDYAAPK